MVLEEEEGEQEIENLFEQIMKENFHNLEKETGFQEVQEAQSPKEAGPKEEHTKAHHNSITQDEREGENLKSSKRKGHSYLQRSSCKTNSWFLKRNFTVKKGLERSVQRHVKQGPTSKITLSSKAII